MRLSIITINYNNLSGLRKTVDSVLAQTWRDFEWIIIDGGSADGFKELIEDIAARPDSQISYWCSEPDKGIYNAMNKGIKKAQGDYLNFMNSGDCYHESTTLAQVFDGKEYDAKVIYGNSIYLNDKCEKSIISPDVMSLDYLVFHSICHQSTFIKKDIFTKYGYYDEDLRIVSDWKLFLLLLLNDESFQYVDVYFSNCDDAGISTNNELLAAERDLVKSTIIPENVEYILNCLHKRQEQDLFFPEMEKIHRYMSMRRLYRRIFRSALFIISMLERFKR